MLSDALNTEGVATLAGGDRSAGLLGQALDTALAAGLEQQTGRAYANLCRPSTTRRGSSARPSGCTRRVSPTPTGTISAPTRPACAASRPACWKGPGRWDEAAALCADVLGLVGTSPVNRLNSLITLGKLRARRAEPGVWECLDKAIRPADGVGESIWIVAARLARAEAHWLAGNQASAARDAALAAEAAAGCDAWERGQIAAWLRRVQPGGPVVPVGPGARDYAEPYRLQAEGHWEKAAQLWTDLGCRYEAALVRYDTSDETALRAALRTFTDLGVAPAAQLTRQKMRQSGIESGPGWAAPHHPGGPARADPPRAGGARPDQCRADQR